MQSAHAFVHFCYFSSLGLKNEMEHILTPTLTCHGMSESGLSPPAYCISIKTMILS